MRCINTSVLSLVLIASASAGCSLIRPASPSSPTSDSTAAEPAPRAPRKPIPRRELEALKGRTVDDARQRLVELGHPGEIRVRVLGGFRNGCGQGNVCDWEYGGSAMILWTNPRAAVMAPPE